MTSNSIESRMACLEARLRLWRRVVTAVAAVLLGLFAVACGSESSRAEDLGARLSAERSNLAKELIAARFSEDELRWEQRPPGAIAAGYTADAWADLRAKFTRLREVEAHLLANGGSHYEGALVLPDG